jgi:hypothetical protein
VAAVVGITQSATSNSFEEPRRETLIKSKVCRALRHDDGRPVSYAPATHQAFTSRTFPRFFDAADRPSLYVLPDRAIQKSTHNGPGSDNCSGWLVGRGDDSVQARPGSADGHFNHKRSTKWPIVLINEGAVQHLCDLLRRTPITAVANIKPPLNRPSAARRAIRISH